MRTISSLKITGRFEVTLKYSTGETVVRNFARLSTQGVFQKLSDPAFFKKVRISNNKTTIQWPGELDLCPDVLFHGKKEAERKYRAAASSGPGSPRA